MMVILLENPNTRNKVDKLFEKGLNVVSIGETLRKTEFYGNKKITHEKSFKNFLEKFNSPESGFAMMVSSKEHTKVSTTQFPILSRIVGKRL